ncbi:hypothetical protein D9615_009828 [Tricholomella constricta]|uniref:Uncharacterized protein n=1 Tax=Tricholomella constricta TaxID=117010 RepID=A0A8H5GX71_9AGAR|nr:hypothetical protein D9615_009828 [Tricholomella constricta]
MSDRTLDCTHKHIQSFQAHKSTPDIAVAWQGSSSPNPGPASVVIAVSKKIILVLAAAMSRTPPPTASPHAPAVAMPKEVLILLTARVRLLVRGLGVDTERDARRRQQLMMVVRRALERAGFKVVDEMGGALVVNSPAVDVHAEEVSVRVVRVRVKAKTKT